MRLALLALLAGCQSVRECGGGVGLDLPGFDVVRLCSSQDADPIEVCSDLDSRELAASMDAHGYTGATCEPTPRHLGPCIYDCDGGTANALQGQWCPPPLDE